MKVAKDGIRSTVHVGYDGRIYKKFRGTDADKRFANEVLVLETLERRGCDYVPKLLESDPDTLTIVTTNCGAPVEKLSDAKRDRIFEELKQEYGVIHDDPFVRNITYDQWLGRFCVIDFELAQILEREDAVETLTIEWASATKPGNSKQCNEDSIAVFGSRNGWADNHEANGSCPVNEEGVIFALSDGMGGPGGGDIASKLAVNELRRFLPGKLGGFKGAGNFLEILEKSVKDLHQHVGRIAGSREGLGNMGATLVCSLFFRKQMYFAHVGDSRLYRFREGKLKQLTMDQTMVGKYFREGQISEREARSHPRRNILMQAIAGGCEYIAPQMGQDQVHAGDWYIICSDGLIDGLWDHRISYFMERAMKKDSSPEKIANEMLEYACGECGRDDTTLFVIRVSEA